MKNLSKQPRLIPKRKIAKSEVEKLIFQQAPAKPNVAPSAGEVILLIAFKMLAQRMEWPDLEFDINNIIDRATPQTNEDVRKILT